MVDTVLKEAPSAPWDPRKRGRKRNEIKLLRLETGKRENGALIKRGGGGSACRQKRGNSAGVTHGEGTYVNTTTRKPMKKEKA